MPPLAILKNVHSFVSQITWWMPHVFVWRSPKRSKMSSSAYNVPHTKYMWTSTWPGLAGFGILSADSVHARPPYSTCRPGHLPRGSVPPGVPDETVLLSKAPGGSPYYMADELILERFGLRHTNTWGTHHVIWLTNECIFPKVDRWGRIYFGVARDHNNSMRVRNRLRKWPDRNL